MTRGFLLGKFMPPHAGHIALVEAAAALVDELTILVCWLPGDPVPGEKRLGWMRDLFPACRVVGHGDPIAQEPSESPDFWAIWADLVRSVHPEPIDFVFAGEAYGLELASHVGGLFVPLGGRVLGMADDPLSGLSGSAVRANPGALWNLLPLPVRGHFQRRICLHGSESTGKSTLATALAKSFGTIAVGEYGRSHCEVHRGTLTLDDLLLIGRAQMAMANAAARWAGPVLVLDTDPLMTAAWCEMLLGEIPGELLAAPKADFYLLLEPDLPWIDDGTRFFADPADRARFADITERVLAEAGVRFERIHGAGEARLAACEAAIRNPQLCPNT